MKYFLFIAGLIINFTAVTPTNGQLRAVDGDSLEYNGQRIRLDGIDAPEFFQTCFDGSGQAYDCGQESWHYLEKLILAPTTCECLPEKDKYGRSICECFSNGKSVNAEMVEKGWARAYRDNNKFRQEEQKAQKAGKGIWQGKHMRPAIHRVIYKHSK